MQQQTVVSWLSQHNFPHGLVSFADGLSRDPLAHKAAYLNKLVKVRHVIAIVAIVVTIIYLHIQLTRHV